MEKEPDKKQSKFTTVRIKRTTLQRIRDRADRLEKYLSERASLDQSAAVFLPGGRSETGKIAPHKIIERLLQRVEQFEGWNAREAQTEEE